MKSSTKFEKKAQARRGVSADRKRTPLGEGLQEECRRRKDPSLANKERGLGA